MEVGERGEGDEEVREGGAVEDSSDRGKRNRRRSRGRAEEEKTTKGEVDGIVRGDKGGKGEVEE